MSASPRSIPPAPSSLPQPQRKSVPPPTPPRPEPESIQSAPASPLRENEDRAHNQHSRRAKTSDLEICTDSSWLSLNSTTGSGRGSPAFILTTDNFDSENLDDSSTPTQHTYIHTPIGQKDTVNASDKSFGETNLLNNAEFRAFTFEGREEFEQVSNSAFGRDCNLTPLVGKERVRNGRHGGNNTGRDRANSAPCTPNMRTYAPSQNGGQSTSRPHQERQPKSEGRGQSTSRRRQSGPRASLGGAGNFPPKRSKSPSSCRTLTPKRMPPSPVSSSITSLGRLCAQTPYRMPTPTSPSAISTGGLSRRSAPISNRWVRDLDSSSLASEPTGTIGRSTCNSSSGARNMTPRQRSTLDRSISSSAVSPMKASVGQQEASGIEKRRVTSSMRREGGIIEKLFGDAVSTEARRSYLPSPNQTMTSNVSITTGASAAAQPEALHTRTLLTASVYHNQATNLWNAVINTNQANQGAITRKNAVKHLKAFSFHSEREARESAYANSPPKMVPFTDSPNCFICGGKFALFRRPSHCRNCGVCICGPCSTTWSSKMIPETYNMKSASNVKVCKSCDSLALAFRRALLDGDYHEAIALYNTGNINLRCPITNVKGGEVMFPTHCATEGGNLHLLRWLVDVHYCPISLVGTRTKKQGKGNNLPILTSKGRSCLSIAMQGQKLEIMRYLVIEKRASVYEIKDLETSLCALESVLKALPPEDASEYYLPSVGKDVFKFEVSSDVSMLEDSPKVDTESIMSEESRTSRNALVIPGTFPKEVDTSPGSTSIMTASVFLLVAFVVDFLLPLVVSKTRSYWNSQ